MSFPVTPTPAQPPTSLSPVPVRGVQRGAATGRPAARATRAESAAAVLTIDHAAIAANIALMREGVGVDVLVVVKANGFGLGAVQVARTAITAGASALGVATVDEAIELRTAGISQRVLAWLGHPRADIAAALRLRIELGAGTTEMLTAIAATATALGMQARVHLQADTGMHRGGARGEDWTELCRLAARFERSGTVRVVGVWSHLANPSNAHWSAVADQVIEFNLDLGTAIACGLRPEDAHLASSGAALAHSRTRYSLVRAGAAIYGIEPVDSRQYGFLPVARVAGRVSALQSVGAGASVGYGGGFVTSHPTTLALVPLGYADGIPRTLAGTGWVSINGVRARIVGAISMDQVVIDVGGLPVASGDEVVFVGDPARGEPSLAEVARWAGTIPQEILTGLGSRFERVHLGAVRVA